MPGLRFEPFTAAHTQDAADLLARRHERHLTVEPLLAAEPDFPALIEAERERDGASGAVAWENGTLVGYLIGAPRQLTNTGLTWMVVDVVGHALEADAESLRDLYAATAARWVDDGHTRHGVYVPSSEPAWIDAW